MSAPGLKITNFHYSKVTFPEYKYQEYPKWIHMTGYPSVIAQTAQEEADLRARTPIQTQHAELIEALPKPEPDDKTLWIEIADKNGIKIDKRWGLEKIKAAVEAHKPE